MKTRGDYMIYRFYNKELNDTVTEFFLPDDCFRRKLERLLTIQSLKEKGYVIVGILYVDKEAYLNARLSDTVQDYLYEDQMEQEMRDKFRKGFIDKETYLVTMQMIQDYKWTCLKKIDIQIRRLVREDFEVHNEIALMLYDQYLKAMF